MDKPLITDRDLSEIAARAASLAFAGDKEGANRECARIPRSRRWAFKERVIMTFAMLKVARELAVFAVN